jgi:predicted DNA-binding protein (UPF0251 family)
MVTWREPRALNLYQAEKIRELNTEGVGQNRLAAMYGVSKSTIKNIILRKTYKEDF